MAIKYSTTTRTNQMTQLATDLGPGALIEVFGNTRAANVATAPGAAPLVTLTCNATAFGTASGGALTANPINSNTATAAGTATWFRAYKSDGTTGVIDGDVAMSGSDLNLNNTNIASGQTVSVTSFVITRSGA